MHILPNLNGHDDLIRLSDEERNLLCQEIREYLETGKTLFVVTRYTDPGARYEKIAEASGVFDLNSPQTYSLYKRVEE